jgi:hypothetical protein
MPSLNFTVFVDQVLDGRKTQTIRAIRKRPIKVGDTLHLFTGMRHMSCWRLSPEGGVACIGAYPIEIDRRCCGVNLNGAVRLMCQPFDASQIERLARDDGFESVSEFFDFFDPNVGDVFRGQLIRWKYWGTTES